MDGLATAIVPAAGVGSRMGEDVKKTYIEIAGKPLIIHTLSRLCASPLIGETWLVVAPEDEDVCRETLLPPHGLQDRVSVTVGGATRQQSVFRGLHAASSNYRYALVHDGARPFVTPDLIRRCLEAAKRHGAATAAVPVKDTLKRSDAEHLVTETVDREWLWKVQTPQAFRRDLLMKAHREAQSAGATATDDASLVERIGVKVKLVDGDERNLKVTTPDDLELARLLLSDSSNS